MCGNGSRCFARFVERETASNRDFTFETGAGIIAVRFNGDASHREFDSPKDLRLNEAISSSNGSHTIHSVNTGVPHAVLFVPDADKAMVLQFGPEIRRHHISACAEQT